MPQPEQWQLRGNAAELYERYVVPYLLGPWAPELVELAALQPGERVLDLACGTGVVARLAAAKVGTRATSRAWIQRGDAGCRSLPAASTWDVHQPG